MKIWVVLTGWYYEGSDIKGIFTTEEKAKDKQAYLQQSTSRYDFVGIEEWDVE